MIEVAIEELPKAIIRRVVKEKLSECSVDGNISLHKDALLAFSESARVFIHYLSATANDLCKESKRQTMNAEDVLKAIEEIDFPEFLGPLMASLEDYRRKNSKKRAGAAKAKAKEVNKKRKDVPPENGGHSEGGVEEDKNTDGNASDKEQQNDADGEGIQDNDDDVDDHSLHDSADRESGEDGVDDQEEQNAVDEEEKHSEDAIENETDVQNDVESNIYYVRTPEPDADEGNQEEEHTGTAKED